MQMRLLLMLTASFATRTRALSLRTAAHNSATLIRNDVKLRTSNPGERLVAQRLAAKLQSDCLIWHDIPIGPKRRRPDFVVLDPLYGITVLEVKDWKLSTIQTVSPDKWTISDVAKAVQNPLEQARDCAQELCSLLEKDSELVHRSGRFQGRLQFPYAYGVVFTRITRSQFNAQPGFAEVLPSHMVIFRDELAEDINSGTFQRRLRSMNLYNFGTTLCSNQIDRIRWHLFPEVRLSTMSKEEAPFRVDKPAPTSVAIHSRMPKILKVMDLQQEQLARNLGDGHRVIHGVAGSGKTLILAFRCAQLASKNGSVLVLCYNVALAAKLRSLVTSPLVTVRHFHGWCSDMRRKHRLECSTSMGGTYIAALETAVISAVAAGKVPSGQYGSVVVDEAHDFQPEWLKLARQMVKPETNSLLILYDDAQNLYGKRTNRQFSFKSIGIKAQGRTTILKLNYRNSVQILTLAYEFAKEAMEPTLMSQDRSSEDAPIIIKPSTAGRKGPIPAFVHCRSCEMEMQYIRQHVNRLHERGTPWNEIAILYRSRWFGDLIFRALKQFDLPIEWLNENRNSRHFDPNSPSIKLMTLHASKGLEFPVVFIAGVNHLPNKNCAVEGEARLLYVGMTRAIEMLHLTYVGSSTFVERTKKALKRVV